MQNQRGHCQECFSLRGAKPERSGRLILGKAGYDSLSVLQTNHAGAHVTNRPRHDIPTCVSAAGHQGTAWNVVISESLLIFSHSL